MRFLAFVIIGFLLIWGVFSFLLEPKPAQLSPFSSDREIMEYAFSQGQKKALRGDYKIRYDSINKTWYWTGSPWNNGRRATYNLNDGE